MDQKAASAVRRQKAPAGTAKSKEHRPTGRRYGRCPPRGRAERRPPDRHSAASLPQAPAPGHPAADEMRSVPRHRRYAGGSVPERRSGCASSPDRKAGSGRHGLCPASAKTSCHGRRLPSTRIRPGLSAFPWLLHSARRGNGDTFSIPHRAKRKKRRRKKTPADNIFCR